MLGSSKLRMFASQGAFVNFLQLNIYKGPIYIVFFPSSCGVVFYMTILQLTHCTSIGQFQKSTKQEGVVCVCGRRGGVLPYHWKFQTKQSFTPRNSIKICYTPQKYTPGQKFHVFSWSLLETPCCQLNPRNSTYYFFKTLGNSISSIPYSGRVAQWVKALQ